MRCVELKSTLLHVMTDTGEAMLKVDSTQAHRCERQAVVQLCSDPTVLKTVRLKLRGPAVCPLTVIRQLAETQAHTVSGQAVRSIEDLRASFVAQSFWPKPSEISVTKIRVG